MGELSKKIGEQGEKIVSQFLQSIGWHNLSENEELPCIEPKKHSKGNDTPRRTHGIDLYYSYRSQLESFTVNNIIVSVKYSSKPYPNLPATTFKSHLKDLAQTVECFSKSEFKNEENKNYEYTGVKKCQDIGILFWLTNNNDSDQDVVSKISNIVLDRELKFSVIHIIDNARASFIYDSISAIKRKFTKHDIVFHHAFGASNFADPSIKKYGSSLPVEYLTSPILPFRIISKENNNQLFCISCIESFNEESAKRLINFASDVSLDFSGDFILIFSIYNELEDKTAFDRAKRVLGERGSRINIEAMSLEGDFRASLISQLTLF
ncbi:hypothetical protein VU04_07355 [Desulfobulbus sp. TB]|nr:hypothetical protein [Desulfobulbus sp. TB]